MNLIRTNVSIANENYAPKPEGLPTQNGKQLFETALHAANNNSAAIKRALEDDDEAEGDGSNLQPPIFDIYRSRQLQKRSK